MDIFFWGGHYLVYKGPDSSWPMLAPAPGRWAPCLSCFWLSFNMNESVWNSVTHLTVSPQLWTHLASISTAPTFLLPF